MPKRARVAYPVRREQVCTDRCVSRGDLGGFLLFAYLKKFEDEASGGAPVKVLVAQKAIEPGDRVTEDSSRRA